MPNSQDQYTLLKHIYLSGKELMSITSSHSPKCGGASTITICSIWSSEFWRPCCYQLLLIDTLWISNCNQYKAAYSMRDATNDLWFFALNQPRTTTNILTLHSHISMTWLAILRRPISEVSWNSSCTIESEASLFAQGVCSWFDSRFYCACHKISSTLPLIHRGDTRDWFSARYLIHRFYSLSHNPMLRS